MPGRVVTTSARAAYAGFAAFGALWGVWGALLPAVREQAGLSHGQLGTALLFIGAGALPAMLLTGPAVDRWGHRVTALLQVALGTTGIVIAVTGRGLVSLSVGLALLGAVSGAADVANNAAAASAEQASGRPVIARAHGVFSAAVVVASLTGGALRATDTPVVVPFVLAAAAGGAAGLITLATTRAAARSRLAAAGTRGRQPLATRSRDATEHTRITAIGADGRPSPTRDRPSGPRARIAGRPAGPRPRLLTAARTRVTAARTHVTAARTRVTAARTRFTAARTRFTAARTRFTAVRRRVAAPGTRGRRPAAPVPAGNRPAGARSPLPLLPLLVAGALVALAFAVENAHQSWSAVYLGDVLSAGPAIAAAGPAVFAGAVAVTRFAVAGLTGRHALAVLVAGALTAAAGTSIVAGAGSAAVAVAGLALAAAGTAVLQPTVFGLVARRVDEADRGRATGVVTTVAYLGFLAGPVYVGQWAGAVGLSGAMLAVAAVAVVLALSVPPAVRAITGPGSGRQPDVRRSRAG